MVSAIGSGLGNPDCADATAGPALSVIAHANTVGSAMATGKRRRNTLLVMVTPLAQDAELSRI
ncbi:hypothetical protein AS9A_1470 [Hoyosella subflava DQS3-9A1]|uniref:Uncharacterized protein n=1 Tax=Hoyosella subflava (strain DSM 45089 / JCM 17490 / NBRC 109087 / DQS3-9A1) TaxID=443218 RepID=F6EH85_HOYSD|nr:hypothetical protein AS9A_1470 [Hoyosella subflava DQS3-9A1]